ncbi:MAG: DUF362 domain-containing protein [Sedimentisphaerales bacterium]|nr:DUF362 domain-containing protein [Sedimentisphaerales bacterium]
MTRQEESYARPTVVVTAASCYGPKTLSEAIERQIILAFPEGIPIRKGDRVLIKPNLIVPRVPESAVQTHPAVILAVAGLLLDQGARPFVADSPGWGSLQSCIHALQLDESLRRLGVPYYALDKPVVRELPDCRGMRLAVSGRALEADAIINLPKFKAHQQLGATFAIKNMFGCVPGKRKAWWHFAKGKSYTDFCSMLIGIYRLFSPIVTIIDGVVAMEGMGPINGSPRPLGVLVGGCDPVACELACCHIAGFDPMDLPILRRAREINFGPATIEQINVLGDPLDSFLCADFEPARQTLLEFSLGRVCRSVTRQSLHLLKGFIGQYKVEKGKEKA